MEIKRKLLSVGLAVIMTMSLASTAYAVMGRDGSVEILFAKSGEEYMVYRVLDLDYVENTKTEGEGEDAVTKTEKLYSYTINDRFQSFFNDNLFIALGYSADPNAANYCGDNYQNVKYTPVGGSVPIKAYSDDGNALPDAVVWCIGNNTDPHNMHDVANKLEKYVDDHNNIKYDKMVKCSKDGSAKINDLTYGFYLMVPTGEHPSVVFSLSTVVTNATIENKSQYPTPVKQVRDLNDETTFKSNNVAAIGDIVEFKITGEVPEMTSYDQYRFVITDTMPNFTYVRGSAKLKIGEDEITSDSEYNQLLFDDSTKKLTVTIPNLKHFTEATKGATIELTYRATIDNSTSLIIGGKGNENKVFFSYSNDPNNDPGDVTSGYGSIANSVTAKTTTFVLQLDLEKVTSEGIALAGTTWKLEKSTASGWVEVAVGADLPTFTGENSSYTFNSTTTNNGDGKFTWSGIDAGTYRLTELTTAPGYVLITNPIGFSITASGTLNSSNEDGTLSVVAALSSTEGHNSVKNIVGLGTTGVTTVRVQNISQSALPSTGGAGLYIVAGVAIVALLGFGGTAMLKRKVNGED